MVVTDDKTGGKILIIEDDSSLLKLISMSLIKKGYLVQACSNANEALEVMGLVHANSAVQSFNPELIIVDMGLPGLSGYDFLQILSRSCPELSHIPYIVLSGQYVDKEDILRGLQLGAFDYLTKPFDLDILFCKVKKALSLYRSQRGMQECTMDYEVFDIKDTAEFLRTSEKTIYSLVKDGSVPAKKIGGQWRFSKKSLLAMFEEE